MNTSICRVKKRPFITIRNPLLCGGGRSKESKALRGGIGERVALIELITAMTEGSVIEVGALAQLITDL